MLESGGEMDLSGEALRAEGGGELGVKHFDRDRPVVPEVAAEPDGGHPAAAELALEGIAVSQAIAEQGHRLGHEVLWVSGMLKGTGKELSGPLLAERALNGPEWPSSLRSG